MKNRPRAPMLFGLAICAAIGAQSAFAAPLGEDIDTCLRSLEEHRTTLVIDADARFKFRSTRGSAVRTIKFRVLSDPNQKSATCKVRRGAVIELSSKTGLVTMDADNDA